jgi:hypothetical protein
VHQEGLLKGFPTTSFLVDLGIDGDFALQERVEPLVHIYAPFISSSRLPDFPLLHHHPSWFLKIRKLPKL